MTAIIIPFQRPQPISEFEGHPPYVIRLDDYCCSFAGTREQLSKIFSEDQFPQKPKRVNHSEHACVKAHRNGIFTAHLYGLSGANPDSTRIKAIAKAIMDGDSFISHVSLCMLQLFRMRTFFVMRGDWSDDSAKARRDALDDAHDRFLIGALDLMVNHPLESERYIRS